MHHNNINKKESRGRLNGSPSKLIIQRWDELFKHVVSFILASKAAQDLIDMYEAISTKVRENPNSKAIEMMLKLQREIAAHKKEAEQYFNTEEEDE